MEIVDTIEARKLRMEKAMVRTDLSKEQRFIRNCCLAHPGEYLLCGFTGLAVVLAMESGTRSKVVKDYLFPLLCIFAGSLMAGFVLAYCVLPSPFVQPVPSLPAECTVQPDERKMPYVADEPAKPCACIDCACERGGDCACEKCGVSLRLKAKVVLEWSDGKPIASLCPLPAPPLSSTFRPCKPHELPQQAPPRPLSKGPGEFDPRIGHVFRWYINGRGELLYQRLD